MFMKPRNSCSATPRRPQPSAPPADEPNQQPATSNPVAPGLFLCNIVDFPEKDPNGAPSSAYEKSLRATYGLVYQPCLHPRRLRREIRRIPTTSSRSVSSYSSSSSSSTFAGPSSTASSSTGSRRTSPLSNIDLAGGNPNISAASGSSSPTSLSSDSARPESPPISQISGSTLLSSSRSGSSASTAHHSLQPPPSSAPDPEPTAPPLDLVATRAQVTRLTSRLPEKHGLSETLRSLNFFLARITSLVEEDARFLGSEAAGIISEDLAVMLQNLMVVVDEGRGSTHFDDSVGALWRWDGILPGVWRPPAPVKKEKKKKGKGKKFDIWGALGLNRWRTVVVE